jgi:hypothetical protein
MAIPITLVSISHDQWYELLNHVSEELYLRKDMAHPSLRAHVRVARAANFDLRNLTHARTLSFKSRRIWLGIQLPGSGKRKLQADTHEALQAWKDILVGTPFFHNMLPSHVLDAVTASADACASTTQAGLGGILRLHGQVVSWFAFNIDYAEAQDIFPWLSDSMQKHINIWELLAQFALAFCLQQVLPGRTSPISVTFACDNTTAEAAHFKALSTSRGLCPILAAFSDSKDCTTLMFPFETSLVLGMMRRMHLVVANFCLVVHHIYAWKSHGDGFVPPNLHFHQILRSFLVR